jgi:hypothetical protein
MSLRVLTCWIATLLWTKLLTREPSNQLIAYNVESTTLDDGDYELVPEHKQGFSGDPANVAKDITEAPNQSSEVSDTTDPSPAQEGKPRCITQYFKLLHYVILYLYIISCIKSRSWNETLNAWIIGTYVSCLSPYRIDALLIGPVEVGWFPVTRAI